MRDFLLILPDWATKPAIAGLVVGFVAAAAWIVKRLIPAAGPGEVRGAPMVLAAGLLALVFGLIILAAGLGSDIQNTPDQIAPWAGLVVVSLGVGVWMIWSQGGVLLRYDRSGVTDRSGRRNEWRALRRIRPAWAGPGVVVVFSDGKSVGMTPDSRGLDDFLIAALEGGAPGVNQLVRKDESVS